MKWQTTAGPRQTKQVEEALSALRRLGNTYTEITGIVGGIEHRDTMMSIGFGGPSPNESYMEAWNGLGEKYGWTITRNNYQQIIADTKEAMKTVVIPEVDRRRTPEQIAQQKQAGEQAQAQREAWDQAFIAAHCLPQIIAVPAGQMAIILQMTYDNSDPMSDYYHPHATYGCAMLLAAVSSQSRTEALARLVLARYPTLSAREWGWHTENYSGGHGNYLQSDFLDEPLDLPAHRLHGNPRLRYEIWFERPGEYHPWREYPGTTPAEAQYQQPDPGTTTAARIVENKARHGIEIHFPGKPDPAILEALKAHRWRWARRSRCWYTQASDEALQFARQLLRQVA